MKKVLKVLLGLVIVLVVLAVIAVIYIDNVAKAGIENGGKYALGVDTTVEDVDISLRKGQMEVRQLKVANPEGFSSPHLMNTASFNAQVDTGTVFSDSITVNHFLLDGLDVHIERQDGKSNIEAIMENIEKLKSGEEKPEDAGDKPTTKVKIDQMRITNVKAHFHLFGSDKAIRVEVPEIVLDGLSSDDPEGVALPELMRRVFPAILSAVLNAAKDTVGPEALKGLQGDLVKLTESVGPAAAELVSEVGGQMGELIQEKLPNMLEGLGEGLQGVGEGIKDGGGGLLDGILNPRTQPASK